MDLNNKTILAIFAHREDHILFGWPVLQNKSINRALLIIADDAENINSEICINENILLIPTVGLKNKFGIQVDTQIIPNYEKIRVCISDVVKSLKPDAIFTHNPHGEYGHADHKFLFSLIYNEFDLPVIISDIIAKSSHCVHYKSIPKDCEWAYKNKLCTAEPDVQFYKRNRQLFLDAEKWTNSRYLKYTDPKKTNLYKAQPCQ